MFLTSECLVHVAGDVDLYTILLNFQVSRSFFDLLVPSEFVDGGTSLSRPGSWNLIRFPLNHINHTFCQFNSIFHSSIIWNWIFVIVGSGRGWTWRWIIGSDGLYWCKRCTWDAHRTTLSHRGSVSGCDRNWKWSGPGLSCWDHMKTKIAQWCVGNFLKSVGWN